MPYQTPFIFRYDCGEFERNMRQALAKSDYAGFARRREESKKRGKLRGIGLANPIEVAGGPYLKPATEWSRIEANADGSVTLISGAMSVGQGHETSLARIAAQALGLPLESVRYVQGDTDAIAEGKGNGGSGGLILGGGAVCRGAENLIDKAKTLAEKELEVAAWDLAYERGVFRVAGSDVEITLARLAAVSQEQGERLEGNGEFQPASATFPNGCHVCEVEIDPQTGAVEVLRYVGVEDVGRVLDPMLVEGQLHGGVAQGLGQALLEQIRYDENGQLLSGSFMDYAMPRAFHMPAVETENPQTPTALNPLGVKGVGEAGTVGALSASMNAICHALAPAGIRHLDMPATPVRVWTALREAGFFS
jgi:carbon-monoxide dehydrogenase large subunit